MASSLSNLVNNLSEGIHRIKCKFGHSLMKETIAIKTSNTAYLVPCLRDVSKNLAPTKKKQIKRK